MHRHIQANEIMIIGAIQIQDQYGSWVPILQLTRHIETRGSRRETTKGHVDSTSKG